MGTMSKREEMIKIIRKNPADFQFGIIERSVSGVEKFIRHHKLGCSIREVVAYREEGFLSPGKKGYMITESYVYYSENGKKLTRIPLDGMVSAEYKNYMYEITVTYAGGKVQKFTETMPSMAHAAPMAKMLDGFAKIGKEEKYSAELLAKAAELAKRSDEMKTRMAQEATAYAEARMKEKAEAETRAKAEAEARAKAEAEARAKAEAEACAKAEAEARAKAEAEARAKAEAEAHAKAEAEARAKAEAEKPQGEFTHWELIRQYGAEMRSIPGMPIGCGRTLGVEEIRSIANSCKNAKHLALKFGKEINSRELENYLNGKHIVQKELVLAFADHGKQGAVLITASYDEENLRRVNALLRPADRRNNNHNLIYRSADGEIKIFTLDEAGVSIHGAYMKQDQLVVWDYLFKPVSFQPGTLGPALAELLQKLVIAFRGEKDYQQIQEKEHQRRELAYLEIQARKKAKEEAEIRAKAEAEASVKAELEARAKAEAEARARAEEKARIQAQLEKSTKRFQESSRARIQARRSQGSQIIDMAAARYRIVQDGMQRYQKYREARVREKTLIQARYQQLQKQIGVDEQQEMMLYEKMRTKGFFGDRKPYKHSERNYDKGIRMYGVIGRTYNELLNRDNWKCGFQRKVNELISAGRLDKLDKLVDCGYPVAMYEKGHKLYMNGRPGDMREAKILFENAIKHSKPDMPKMEQYCYVYAFYYLGRICERGVGVDKDPMSAVSFFQDALRHKDAVMEKNQEYQNMIRDCYQGIARNFSHAVLICDSHGQMMQEITGALKGSDLLAAAKAIEPYLVKPVHRQELRKMYQDSKTEEGALQAQRLYMEDDTLADRGLIVCDGVALSGGILGEYQLGVMFEEGVELPKDLNWARFYYNAAASNIPMAAYRLALLYRDGRGVSRDMEKARTYMKMAADAGVKEAQSALVTLEKNAVLLPDQARELERQGRMKEAMEVWHQAVLEQYFDMDGERLAQIWLEGKQVSRNVRYAMEARYANNINRPYTTDWKTLMHQMVDGEEMAPDYLLGWNCARHQSWKDSKDLEAVYYKNFCKLFLYVQRGMDKPKDFYPKLIQLLKGLPDELRREQLSRLAEGVHGLEGMIACAKYMAASPIHEDLTRNFVSPECLVALWGFRPGKEWLDIPSVAAEEAFCQAEMVGASNGLKVRVLCQAYEKAAQLGHMEADRILSDYFADVKEAGAYSAPKTGAWSYYDNNSAAWMALNGYEGGLKYMCQHASDVVRNWGGGDDARELSRELGDDLWQAIANNASIIMLQSGNPRAVCDCYCMLRDAHIKSARLSKNRKYLPDAGIQKVLRSIISGDGIYAPACQIAWSDEYALAKGRDRFGNLTYWDRKEPARIAQFAGYIESEQRAELLIAEDEQNYRNNVIREKNFRARLEAQQEAMERAMEEQEEMERLQEERRQEMAERRRQDEAMDRAERFFNMLSGQGDWTNEELARMGKKTSDEIWTDERLREMYRDKF